METNVKAVELRELWRRYKDEGDEKARERLVVAYSPLVKFVAGRMAAGLPSHVEEADLISYGLLGLIGAIERFEPERDIKFETFAVARIKGAIIDELRSLDWVPRSVRARARDIERAHAELEHEARRAPRPTRRWPSKLEMDVEEFRDALLQIANSSVLALDDLWTFADPERASQISLLDTIQDPNAVDPAARRWPQRGQGPARRRDRVAARARAPGGRALLLREPHPARDRRGPRRHRVPRLAAAHEGRAAACAHASVASPALSRRRWPTRPPTGSETSRCRSPGQRQDQPRARRSCSRPGSSTGSARVEDGTTVSDFEPDEQEREMSIGAAVAVVRARWPQDQPDRHAGRAELRRRRARRPAGGGRGGRRRQRRDGRRGPHRAALASAPIARASPRLVFVNMLDRERADFFRALDSLKAAFGQHVVATEIPIGSEHEVRGVIDLIDMKAFVVRGRGARRPRAAGRDPRRAARRRPRSTARS